MTRPSRFDVLACPLDGSSLVEASAGTGKTWNLCALYLRLLLERGLDVQNILVVTFTKAATAELRERVRSRIVETLAYLKDGRGADAFVRALVRRLSERQGVAAEAMTMRLELALGTFDEAAIFTIHGFCQRALSDTPFAARLPLKLEAIHDDDELRLQAVNDFWRRHFAGGGVERELAAFLALRGDTPAGHSELLKRRLARPLARCEWPQGIDATIALDAGAVETAYLRARSLWTARRDAIVACLLAGASQLPQNRYKADSIETAADGWDVYFASDDATARVDWSNGKLDLFCAGSMVPKRNCVAPAHAFFDAAEALVAAHRSFHRSLGIARLQWLRRLFDEGAAALARTKQERRVIAFDDMLSNVRERLARDETRRLAAALRQRFPAALIDEFQDTDPVQFEIFKSVYVDAMRDGDASLFLVGDPKQAIYSFRHADLHTYLRARRDARSVHTLQENQRAAPELIGALNALFGANPAAFMIEGLAYGQASAGARERPILDDRSAPRAPLQVWMLPGDNEGAPLALRDAQDAALDATAAEIARLIREGQQRRVVLDGRGLRAGDIAVLVRTHAEGNEMRLALSALGVGSALLSQDSVYQSSDAQELERVLAAIAEPSREGLARSALATTLIGCSAAALEAISNDETLLAQRMVRLVEYRDEWRSHGVAPMLRMLMRSERVAERMLARPDGERRMTNLLHLAELLHEAAESRASPPALLRWLQARRGDESGDETAQLRLESDRNLVQILTVHRAKGLEFPIVFCPFLWKARQLAPPPRDCFEYHDDEGRAVFDFRKAIEGDIDAAELESIRNRRKLEAAAEEARLVYVALTRAVHRCYLVAGLYRTRHGKGRSTSSSRRSVLNWLVAGRGHSAASVLDGGLKDDEVEAGWRALGKAAPARAGIAPMPTESGMPVGEDDAAGAICLRAAPRIQPGWRVGSYSSLTRGALHELAASDRDADEAHSPSGDPFDEAADTAVAERTRAAPALDANDMLLFPRGPGAGDCVHAVFESVSFADRRTWTPAIDAALRAHPQPMSRTDPAARGTPSAGQSEHLAAMLAGMLDAVVQTELRPGLRLASVARRRCLAEFGFTLPAGRLTSAALDEALHSIGYRSPAPSFAFRLGYLKGFIDLVFEHEGRWYVVDWKSNHLGFDPADYSVRHVERAVASNGYRLQALLYTVALDRWLRRRLRGYRHEDHFGGALVLFVRAVRPGWRNEDGSPCGVFFDRPPAAAIERLSALFGARPQ